MPDTAKRLAGPTLVTNTEQTLYTVPTATTAVLRHIQITNTGAATYTFKMSVGADAAGTRIFDDVSIGPDETFVWTGFFVLAAAETLRMQASTTNVLTVSVSGVEVS